MTTFKTVADLEAAPTADLIVFYNSLNPEKPVKKFSDRQTALKRCAALLESQDVEEVESSEDAQTAKVRADLEEAHAEFAAEGGEALESADGESESTSGEEEKPKFKWPFAARGEATPAPKAEEAPKKSNVGHASNSAGVAASWADPEVHAARLQRDGVAVTVNGKTTEHKSTREAFRHYRLLDSKHIRFRGELKKAGEAVYTENGVDYAFKIVPLAKKEKKPKKAEAK